MKELIGILFMIGGGYGLYLSTCLLFIDGLVRVVNGDILIGLIEIILSAVVDSACIASYIYGYHMLVIHDIEVNDKKIKDELETRIEEE